MPVLTIVENDSLPTGEYIAKVDNVEEVTGQYGVQLKWTLEVADGDFKGKQLPAWTQLSASLKGKLAKWSKACGIELEDGDIFDTDDLKGSRCTVVVVETEAKDGSGSYGKVMDLKPPKAGKKPKPAPAEESDVFEGE
jgi:hypothetical protein